MDWYGIKEWLEVSTGLHMDALHVHAGILCLLAAALLLRRPLASIWPWLAVLAVVLANEAYDLRYETWPNQHDQLAESAKDVWNTMLLPTVLLLVCRFMPRLATGRKAAGRRSG